MDDRIEKLEAENERLRQIISLGEDQVFALEREIERLRAAAGGEQGGEGLVLIPKEPTEEMLQAAIQYAEREGISYVGCGLLYRAMIEAAIAGGEQGGDVMSRASALLATVWDMKQLSNPPTVGIGIDWLIARLTEVVGGERGGEDPHGIRDFGKSWNDFKNISD